MYNLTLTNKQGNSLVFNSMGGPFTITEIQGLNPPNASINTNSVALLDGGLYNSAKLEMRTINLAFAIEYNAEANRMEIYKVLHAKKYIKLNYKSEYRDVYIEGYIQSIDITYFEMKQICTVSILCPEPYLKSAEEVIDELSAIINGFHFPFGSTEAGEVLFGYIDATQGVVIENKGYVETGLTFVLFAKDEIVNPKIINTDTQEYIELNFTMQAQDTITITTSRGNKTVTLLRNGVLSSIFNSFTQNSTWLQLELGNNHFVYTDTSGDLEDLTIQISHNDLFEGV